MTLHIQQPILFDNTCGCIFDENLLESAIIWYSDKPVQKKKTVSMYGVYPGVSIGKAKIHVHRLIMMYNLRRKLPSSKHVHHKDGNKLNCNISNLELLNASEHLSAHNKGKILTEAHRSRIAEAGKKRKGMKMKKRVDVPAQEVSRLLSEGWSINRISKHFRVDWSTVKNRIYENPELLKKGK